MKSFIKRIRTHFAWRESFCEGGWSYQVNKITGDRRIINVRISGGFQPFNQAFLDPQQPPTRDAKWTRQPPLPKR